MKMWSQGLRFQCQGSGGCCVSRDGYGFVYMTPEDRRRMAQYLGIKTAVFTKMYCYQVDGIWALKDGVEGRCQFLENNKCSVYKGRPTQCRTWPFWPEVLKPKVWNGELTRSCPGVGKGKTWTAQEIELQLKEQIKSESQYGQ